jgi:GTPase SAR1 family protein
MLNEQQWEPAAALLQEFPALLTHGSQPAVEHTELPLLLATAPRVAQRLNEGQHERLRQTLATSALKGIDLRTILRGDASHVVLARLARERRLPTLVWAELQLGDGGAQQLVKELASGDEPSAVTSLDLRQNGLTTLPLELLELPVLTELQIDDPGMQCSMQLDETTSMTVRGRHAITSVGAVKTMARLARERRLPTLVWAGLQLGDGGAQQLVKELASGDEPSAVTSLDLRQNGLTTLPLELLELPALTELHFNEHRGLDPTLAKVLSTQGLPGLLKLLPDLHGNPKPSYVLKTVLAGPTMAGKTSLLNALRGLERRLTDPKHGRTIGLDIGRLELRDARAGRYTVIFLTYDAGGHDEYQEMHQTFLSHNTLYILVWNVALESDDHQLEEKMASWATLLQTCAPGSRVLLVASHADEAEDPTAVPGRCQRMVTAVRGMLDQHRAEQQRELDRLAVLPATGNEQARKQLLEDVLKNPLQLAQEAVIVSAATLQGIPELRQCMLDAAFDKSSFPSFGSNQPNMYLNILRQARQSHGDQLSVTMADMQASLSVRPDVYAPFSIHLVQSTVVNATADNTQILHKALNAAKHACWDELQTVLFPDGSNTCVLPSHVLNRIPHPRNYGLLHHLAYSGAVDAYQALLRRGILFDSTLLTLSGETAQKIAEEYQHPEFVKLMAVVDAQASTNSISIQGTLAYRIGSCGEFSTGAAQITNTGVLTVGSETADLTQARMTVAIEPPKQGLLFCVKVSLVDPARQLFLSLDNAGEQQRWREGIQQFVPAEVSAATVEYTFTISLCGEQVKDFAVQHSVAKQIHSQLAKEGVCAGLSFPDPKMDFMRDMVHVEENVARRGQVLLTYYQALFARADTLAAFAPIMGFDLDELRKQRCELANKVRSDPGLLNRAIVYLTNAGEVLSHDSMSSSSPHDRVFLEPQRLVDVMKELVHHDLSAAFKAKAKEDQLQSLDTVAMADAIELQKLGRQFLHQGILERRLLPWLWRNLTPSVAGDEAQIDFLLDLLVQLGLLTRLPGVDPPQWILPLRLPDRRTVLAAADARKQLAPFLYEMESENRESTPATSLTQVVDRIASEGTLSAETLISGRDAALAKADEILNGAEYDANGLCRDEIAAINFYTQVGMVYQPMNSALRRQESALIRPFWPYIKLLQQALLKLPVAQIDLLYRGVNNPQPRIATSEWQKRIDHFKPDIWWAFTSTTTNLGVATHPIFLGNSGHRVLFQIRSSAARDVKDYSAIPTEDELLMPCGIGLAPTKVEVDTTDPEKLTVSLEQTEAMLLEDRSEATALEVHQHPALAALAETLESVAVDYVGRRWDFHQPLPPGLFTLVLSRCAALCTEQTAIWRRDLITVIDNSRGRMEVSLQQQGLSYVLIAARCQAGGHHRALQVRPSVVFFCVFC